MTDSPAANLAHRVVQPGSGRRRARRGSRLAPRRVRGLPVDLCLGGRVRLDEVFDRRARRRRLRQRQPAK
jgi:hypothetical protein